MAVLISFDIAVRWIINCVIVFALDHKHASQIYSNSASSSYWGKKTFADFAISAQHGTEIWAFDIWCLNAVPSLCEEMLGKILNSWTELNWNGIINITLFWNSDDYFA